MVRHKQKGQADVILLIATYVIFVKSLYISNINWIHVFHVNAFDTIVYWKVLIL